VVKDLVEAFVKANIPLEKVNALRPFFRKYCKESSLIPQADALRRQYLPEIYQQSINDLKE
ncbi:34505_t:CDS:1, partial [Gigaspora margarita]